MNKQEKFFLSDQAWLGLDDHTLLSKNLYNPFHDIGDRDPYIVAKNYIREITKPEYFHYFCQRIMNVQLLPIQGAIIRELWKRKFPMLMMTRGGSKSWTLALYSILRAVLIPGSKVVLTGAGFRQSKGIFEYCERFWQNAPVLRDICDNNSGARKDADRWTFHINSSTITAIPIGCMCPETLITTSEGIKTLKELSVNETTNEIWSNGKFRRQGFFYDSGVSPCFEVTTKAGYRYKATPNHKMKVVRNSEIVWVRTDELVLGDRILIDRSNRWHNQDTEVSVDDAYCLGLMIGDGSYVTDKKLRYTSFDMELHSAIRTIGDFHMNPDNQHADLGVKGTKKWFDLWGVKPSRANNKSLPEKILRSSKEKMRACLQGLFDTDGHISILSKNIEPSGVIGYTTVSKQLAYQIQYVLLHFGVICKLSYRDRERKGVNCQRAYELRISGNDIERFNTEVGFRLKRKQAVLESFIKNRRRRRSYGDTIPIDTSLVPHHITKDRKTLTFDRAVECGFSHELVNTNFYYDEVKNIEQLKDQQMYDINIPEGNEYCANGFYSHNTGEKIRGLRANVVACDEFRSVRPDIYETVIGGFGAVTQDPITNTIKMSKMKYLEKYDLLTDVHKDLLSEIAGNQSIIAGTPGYTFEHFYEYWNRWKKIIACGNDRNKLADVVGEENADKINPADWSIIRIPYDMIPPGFMDEKQIARAKATIHSGIFISEYATSFAHDSLGFFKRTTIEGCTANDKNVLIDNWPKYCDKPFDAKIIGDSRKKYVFGIDPASESDNFSIVVLETYPDHNRVVYCWTARRNKKSDDDFFTFCIRKIRTLMSLFPCSLIGIDTQGGGRQIIEGLHDKARMIEGDQPIWPVEDWDDPKPTDGKPGLHIIEEINFAKPDWTSQANHGLRADMEHRHLLFPRYDQLSLGLAEEMNRVINPNDITDHLDIVIEEIEELKNELCTIVMTQTGTVGRDRWDTPEIKTETGKKGKLRKDRYSALVIANMIARTNSKKDSPVAFGTVGGLASQMGVGQTKGKEQMYSGNTPFSNVDPGLFGAFYR